jgi:hypothetical protein
MFLLKFTFILIGTAQILLSLFFCFGSPRIIEKSQELSNIPLQVATIFSIDL